MSQLRAFSVYDQKAGAYLQPFFMKTKQMALRAIGDLVNDFSHSFSQHKEDYTLYEVGVFDETTGIIAAPDAPQVMCNLVELFEEERFEQLKLFGQTGRVGDR